jgi:hypothetical protein
VRTLLPVVNGSLGHRWHDGGVSRLHPAPGSSDEWLASIDPVALANQLELGKFTTWLIELPGIQEAGCVTGINDAESKATTLLWAGESAMHDIVRAEANRRGITLAIRPVRYSAAHLDTATRRLWACANRPEWDGFRISYTAGTNATRDGISVGGEYETPSERPDAERLADTLAFAQSIAPEVVEVEIGSAVPLGHGSDQG